MLISNCIFIKLDLKTNEIIPTIFSYVKPTKLGLLFQKGVLKKFLPLNAHFFVPIYSAEFFPTFLLPSILKKWHYTLPNSSFVE